MCVFSYIRRQLDYLPSLHRICITINNIALLITGEEFWSSLQDNNETVVYDGNVFNVNECYMRFDNLKHHIFAQYLAPLLAYRTLKIEYHAVGDTWWQPLLSYDK